MVSPHARWFLSFLMATAVPATALAEPESSDPTIAPAPAAPSKADEPYTGPPTLFGYEPKVGWYAGPSFAYSRIDHGGGLLAGLEACLLLDHELAIGLTGLLWGNETHGPPASNGSAQNLEVFYGGAVFRYAMFTEYIVYPSLGSIVGAGAGTLVPEDGSHVPRSNTDTFFVFEPQLGAHSNITRWMRVTLHVGYRMAAGVTRFGYDESEYSSLSLGGAVQLGRL